jgi:hypothetical protein
MELRLISTERLGDVVSVRGTAAFRQTAEPRSLDVISAAVLTKRTNARPPKKNVSTATGQITPATRPVQCR